MSVAWGGLGRGARATVVLFVATMISLAGLLLVAGWMLFDGRRDVRDKAEQTASNLAMSLAQDIAHTVAIYDLSLQSCARVLRLLDAMDLPQNLRPALLFDGATKAQDFGAIVVTNEAGQIIYRPADAFQGTVNLGDRSYFGTHRQFADAGLLFTVIRDSRVSNANSLVMSRRVDHPDGSFAGTVVGGIKVRFFDRIFGLLRFGSQDGVALFMTDRTLIARDPARQQNVGLPLIGADLVAQVLARGEVITERSSPLDGVRRITVSRQVGHYPLILTVGLGSDAVYADWWRKASVLGVVVILLVTLAAVLLYRLARALQRRAAAEHVARTGAAELRQLSDSIDDIILRIDWDAKRLFVSSACERLLGYKQSQLMGGSAATFIHPDERHRFLDGLAAMARGEIQVFIASYRVRHADGHWVHMESRNRVLPDRSGAIVAVRDVTERVTLEAQLREAQRTEAIGRLSAGVAHDFNNLLQVQIGNLELLQDAIAEGGLAEAADFGATALAMAERAAALTNHLLSFSRQQILQPRPIAVGPFLGDLVPVLQRTLGPAIQISTDVDARTGHVFADPALFETALLNLAFNARDAMPHGGLVSIEACPITTDVATTTLAAGRYVVVAVTDDGIGMTAAMMKRAIEPFFTTKGPNGSGLGLAMVHGFTRQSLGDLRIESEPGQGARFEMWLPAAVTPAVDTDAAAADAVHGLAGRVLLVDDVRDVLLTVSAFLSGAGLEVVTAMSGEAALAMLDAGERFDILVTDYAMPGLSGADLILKARDRLPDLLALVITGFADRSVVERLPNVRILHKPFRRAGLLEAVRDALVDGIAAAEAATFLC